MAAVRAPNLTWAVSPPAPWHMGIPPRSPDATFPRPQEMHTLDGVTRHAAPPKHSRARSVTATTALPKVSGSWGMTSRTNAEPNADTGGSPGEGRSNEGPASSGRATAQAPRMPAAITASARPNHPRRAARATTTKAATARATGHGDGGLPRKTAGGSRTRRAAAIASRTPTPNWRARTTGLVNNRARRSATRWMDSSRRNRPISRPAAWITSGASRSATATAVRALSGWTGKGTRKARPEPSTRIPATSITVPASRPFTRIRAAASGTRTPRSPTAPVASPNPSRAGMTPDAGLEATAC
jgi:hypothetical protein